MAHGDRPQLWQTLQLTSPRLWGKVDLATRDRVRGTLHESSLRREPLIPTLSPQEWGEGELLFVLVLGRLFALALKRGAEDVAERGARVGGAVLGDRLLLLGDFQRLDRDRNLVRAAVELGYPCVDL